MKRRNGEKTTGKNSSAKGVWEADRERKAKKKKIGKVNDRRKKREKRNYRCGPWCSCHFPVSLRRLLPAA